MRAAALALAPLLAGCAVVIVHTDGGRPQLSAWPAGVRIERGQASALSVSVRTLGVVSGPYTLSAGATSIDADVIDPTVCSAALVHAPARRDLISRLAAATRAECPKPRR